MSRRLGGLAGAALLIGAVTAVARIAGFGRNLVFARTVGFDCLGSVYQTANTVPNIVFEVVAGGALAALVVPLIAGAVSAGDTAAVSRTSSALLTWTLCLLIPAGLVAALLAQPVVSLLVGTPPSGCDRAATVEVGARMLQVFAIQVPLYGVGLVLAGVAQAHRRFLGPTIAPLLSSLVVIGAYLSFAALSGAVTVDGLAQSRELVLSLGTTAGVAVLSLSLLIPLRGTGLRIRPRWRFDDGVARRARALALAGAATLAAQQLAVAVGLRLANDHGSSGAVVLFVLASTVFLLPWAVLSVPLATSAFPRSAAAYSKGDTEGWVRITTVTAKAVLLTATGAAAACLAVAEPLARVLARGAPGHPDLRALAFTICALAPGLLGYGLVAHLGRALAARDDARGAAVATAAGWLVVAAVDVVAVRVLGDRWAAVGLGIGSSVGLTLAGLLLASRAGSPVWRDLLPTGGRTLVAATPAAAIGLAVVKAWGPQAVALSLVQVAVVGTLVTAVFGSVLLVLDRSGLHELWAGLRA